MKILICGDGHIDNDNLEECQLLYNLIYDSIVKYKPDFFCELGDTIDGFNFPSLRAQHFLTEQAQRLSKLCPIVFLVGNHSHSPNSPDSHSLLPLKFLKNVTVVDKPMSLMGLDFVPFRRDKYQFEKEANSLPNDILFCHQPVKNAVYESGWHDTDGIEPEKIKHKKVISGHIHAEGTIGQVWYPGSPRYMKKSDANSDKNIYLYDTDTDEYTKISTWPSVTKMVSMELTEMDIIPSLNEFNVKYYVTLKGSFQFCQQAAEQIGDKAEIKTILTKQKKNQIVRQSTVELSLKSYLINNYKLLSDISRETLLEEVNKRLQ
jgi:DNA repair exonuclease SbcCD nuclease subunit